MARRREPSSRLDPRGPLVLETRELGRRAGSMREVRRTVPAPDALRLELVEVPPGSDIELDLRLESVMEGVLVSGTATAELQGECARCLEPFTSRLEVNLQELFVYPDSTTDSTADEDEVRRLDHDLLDLEPVLRDAIVLALPMTPLCRPDCRGLCAGCGQRLDELPAGHGHEAPDPRWAGLAERFGTDSSTRDRTG